MLRGNNTSVFSTFLTSRSLSAAYENLGLIFEAYETFFDYRGEILRIGDTVNFPQENENLTIVKELVTVIHPKRKDISEDIVCSDLELLGSLADEMGEEIAKSILKNSPPPWKKFAVKVIESRMMKVPDEPEKRIESLIIYGVE